MRIVFNYRKAMREPKKIQQITEKYSLPFAIELLPVLNFIIFAIVTFGVGYLIRLQYPMAFQNTFVLWGIGIPLALTILVRKFKLEGKNIYMFFWDLTKYYLMIKLPNKKFCNDMVIKEMSEKVTFRKMVNVKGGKQKYEYIKNSDEDVTEELFIDENGRGMGVLSDSEQVYSNAK